MYFRQFTFEIACDKQGFGGKTSEGYGRSGKPVMKTSAAFTEEEKTKRLRREEMARKVSEEAARLAEAEHKAAAEEED